MVRDLKDLGYSDAEINTMTPQEAWDILNSGVKNNKKITKSTEEILEILDLIRNLRTKNTQTTKSSADVLEKQLDTSSPEYIEAKKIDDSFQDIINQIKNLGDKGEVQVNC